MFSHLKDEDKVYKNLIGGDWIIADDSKLIEIKSPVDGRIVGKDKNSADSEVIRTADFIRFTADAAKNLVGESLPGESFPGYKKGKISIVKREPVGVVLAI